MSAPSSWRPHDHARESSAPACRAGSRARNGQVVLDQIRTVDLRAWLSKRLGRLDARTSVRVLDVLQEMFSP